MIASPKIKARIKKCLALANSPNEHEAEVARDEAERLMVKHGFTLADFEESVIEVVDDQCNDLRLSLARAIGASRRVGALVDKNSGKLAFRGRAEPTTNAAELYRRLVADVSQRCEIGPRDPGRVVWRLCYWQGFVEAVCDRLLDEEVQSWVKQTATSASSPPSEEAPVGEAVLAPPSVPSVQDQQRVAIKEFSGYFIPDDVQRAVRQLCSDAYEGGKRAGQSVALEKYERNGAGSPDRALRSAT